MTSQSQSAGRGARLAMLMAGLGGMLVVGLLMTCRPFSLPSASGEPMLRAGDIVLVSKWSYGCGSHTLLVCPRSFAGRLLFHAPKRGDLVVFKATNVGASDYVKRIVGLPGDRVQLEGGILYINGTAVTRRFLGDAYGSSPEGFGPTLRYEESPPGGHPYPIQLARDGGPSEDTGIYAVPAHCYFTLGDNRDDSLDSRFDPGPPADPSDTCGWDSALDGPAPSQSGVGFVPEQNLIGRVRLVLFSLGPEGLRLKRFAVPVW